MTTIPVRSLKEPYKILVGRSLLERAGTFLLRTGLRGKVLIVTQERVARLHLKTLEGALRKAGFKAYRHFLPEGEVAKSQKELFAIFKTLLGHDFERRDAVLAFGGGIVGDAAGFAASVYLRGIAFVNAGTTLLAQVDSSIGGKTAINLPEGKNLVGSFYPPKLVVSDIRVLGTLAPRELCASLAEVVKYGVIRDPGLFRFLEKNAGAILGKDPAALERIVTASARIKAGVVGRDEFETRGERMILNFGHTFGHGFEQALGYRKLMHGEAVSIGMACAAGLAVSLGIFPKPEAVRIERLLKRLNLPVSLSGFDVRTAEVLEGMGRDKKKKAGRLRFVLPVAIGRVVVREDVAPARVIKIIDSFGGKS